MFSLPSADVTKVLKFMFQLKSLLFECRTITNDDKSEADEVTNDCRYIGKLLVGCWFISALLFHLLKQLKTYLQKFSNLKVEFRI